MELEAPVAVAVGFGLVLEERSEERV